MGKEEDRNAHSIVTKYFNNHLNKFITIGAQKTVIGKLITGGLQEFEDSVYNIFNRLSGSLENWRNDFLKEYSEEELTKTQIKEALEPLIKLYENGASYQRLNQTHRDILNNQFISELKSFFKEIDKLYSTRYFADRIAEINVNQDVVSDYEFARQYFGKVSRLGVAIGKEEISDIEHSFADDPNWKEKDAKIKEEYVSRLEKELDVKTSKTKEAINDFAKEAYTNSTAEVEGIKVKTLFHVTVDNKEDQYVVYLKRYSNNELYIVNKFTTNTQGIFTTKIWLGEYLVELVSPKIPDCREKIKVSKSETIEVNFKNGEKEPEKEVITKGNKKTNLLDLILVVLAILFIGLSYVMTDLIIKIGAIFALFFTLTFLVMRITDKRK